MTDLRLIVNNKPKPKKFVKLRNFCSRNVEEIKITLILSLVLVLFTLLCWRASYV